MKYLEIADVLLGIVQQLHHFAGRPEMRSILPKMPSLIRPMAPPACRFHFPLDDIFFLVAVGEEDISWSSERLCLRPTENILGARIPRGDIPVQIECGDAEVGGAIDELAVPRLKELPLS